MKYLRIRFFLVALVFVVPLHVTLFFNAEAVEPRAFLPRYGMMSNSRNPFSQDEMEALNCNSDGLDDCKARFAIQYQVERESLRLTESGYLQLRKDPHPISAKFVVPVTRRSVTEASLLIA